MLGDDILGPQDWTFPVPIFFGAGRIAELGERVRALGVRNPLIVTDRGSTELPFIARLQTILSDTGLGSAIFCDISPNPRDDEIGDGCQAYIAGKHDGIIGIGSGGNYALAAARALAESDMDAEAIAKRAMQIAAEICVYTNDSVVVETLDTE